MSCISKILSCVSLCTAMPQETKMPNYNWPQAIHADNMRMEFVTNNSNAFRAICDMYQLDQAELAQELETMAIWCIYNESNQPIGAIQLDYYHTLENFEKQVSDKPLAKKLFESKKFLEISYALTDENHGKGLGSKAVKTFIDLALTTTWGKHIYAVVDEDNPASIKILEKNGFSYLGNYIHEKTQDNTRVYSL